jgi:hypothetical protein
MVMQSIGTTCLRSMLTITFIDNQSMSAAAGSLPAPRLSASLEPTGASLRLPRPVAGQFVTSAVDSTSGTPSFGGVTFRPATQKARHMTSAAISSNVKVLQKAILPERPQRNAFLFVSTNALEDCPSISRMIPVHFPYKPQVAHACQAIKEEATDLFEKIRHSDCVAFTTEAFDDTDTAFTRESLLRLGIPKFASSLRCYLRRVTHMQGTGWDLAWDRVKAEHPNHGLNPFETSIYTFQALRATTYGKLVSL